MVKFEKVIDGINRYLNYELYAGMNDWQEIIARMAVSRVVGNTDSLKHLLETNPIAKMFAIIDSEGNVDVDGIMKELREQMAHKGKIEFSVPLFGKFTFSVNDVDKLYNTIMEG